MLRLIPLKYNFRSIGRRRLRTALTVLGIALVVFISILMYAFSQGMQNSLTSSASKNNAIILNSNASTDLTLSRVDKAVADEVAAGIMGAKEEYGQRYISPEVHLGTNIRLQKDSRKTHMGLVRGVRPIAFKVHPQVEITQGAPPQQGHKIMLGKLVATKLNLPQEELSIGRTIYFEENAWTIVGFFEAPGTVFESEIWCDADDLMMSTLRQEYSAISITLADEQSFAFVDYFCKSRLNLELQAWKEEEFYSVISETIKPMALMVYAMVALVTFGGMLVGMNTMYTSVLGRFRELGTLRVLGFGKISIVLGLCLESMAIAAMGGLLGAFAARLAHGISLRFPMGAFAFDIDFEIMLLGLAQALVIGFLGALVPGFKSVRMKLVDSIRAV